jgi:hypothetical protein
MLTSTSMLRIIKSAHTLAWAFFASAIVLIPFAAWTMNWPATSLLIALVSVECIVVAMNGMKCPLTPLAARYTDDRSDNFDIYLPLWLARYNKQVFGGLFLAGILFSVVRFALS